MSNRIYAGFFVMILLLFLNGCKTMNIDRGRIEDSWSMKILGQYSSDKVKYYSLKLIFPYANIKPTTNKTATPLNMPVSIKSNTFFNPVELDLMENPPMASTTVCSAAGYKHLFNSYEVEIENSVNNNKYYGHLAFFKAKSKAAAKAVTSYYKMSFPSDKFSECTDGRIAFYYEYYDIGKQYFPTWILWVSDVPIK